MAAEPVTPFDAAWREARPGRRTIGYCRKSPKGGGAAAHHYEDVSLDDQERELRAFCEAQGLDLLDVRHEKHVRYELHARRTLMEILEECRRGLWDVIVAYDPYRWSGDPDHASWLRVETDRAGVTVRLVRDDPGEGHQGRLLGYVGGYVSKVEHENIKDRTGRGKRIRLDAGKSLPHPHAYGYRWNHEVDPSTAPLVTDRFKYLLAHEAEAPRVRQMYAWVDPAPHGEGRSSAWVARTLNERGVPGPQGGIWRQGTVARMLRSVVYLGHEAVYQTRRQHVGRGEDARTVQRPAPRDGWRVTERKHEPLVDADRWERVQEALEDNRSHRRREHQTGARYLLTGGLAVCDACDAPLIGRCGSPLKTDRLGTFGPRDSVRYYVCPTTQVGRREAILAGRAPACTSPGCVRADVLDRLAWAEVVKLAPPPLAPPAPARKGERRREADRLSREEARLRKRLDEGMVKALDEAEPEKKASLERVADATAAELKGVVAERERLQAGDRAEAADRASLRALFDLLTANADRWSVLVPWGPDPGQDGELRAVLRALRARARVKRWSDLAEGEEWYRVQVGPQEGASHVSTHRTASPAVIGDMELALRRALASVPAPSRRSPVHQLPPLS